MSDNTVTDRERAITLLKAKNLTHVIYGYTAGGVTTTTGWENEMLKFSNDENFQKYIDLLQSEHPNLEMIYAVHA